MLTFHFDKLRNWSATASRLRNSGRCKCRHLVNRVAAAEQRACAAAVDDDVVGAAACRAVVVDAGQATVVGAAKGEAPLAGTGGRNCEQRRRKGPMCELDPVRANLAQIQLAGKATVRYDSRHRRPSAGMAVADLHSSLARAEAVANPVVGPSSADKDPADSRSQEDIVQKVVVVVVVAPC